MHLISLESIIVTSESVVQDDETCTRWLWINHRKIQGGDWVCLLPLLDPILTYGGVGWILPWLCSFALAYSLIPIQKAKLIWTNLLGHIYHAMKFSMVAKKTTLEPLSLWIIGNWWQVRGLQLMYLYTVVHHI